MPDSSQYVLSVDVIGAKELSAALKSSNPVIMKALTDAINKTALAVERKAKQNAPHLSGGLQGSLHREAAVATRDNVTAKVGTNLIYGRAQEYGFPPGYVFPNWKSASMQKFAKEKLGNAKLAFVVARGIFQKGMKGKFYLKKAKEDSVREMSTNMQEAMRKIIDYFVKGVSGI